MMSWGHPCGPCRRMILTVMTDQSTLQTTNETASSPLLPPPPARWWQQDQGRASLVVCIHYVEGKKATPARSSDAGDAVCVRATGPCCVVSIGSPISLAVERKPSKYDRKKKLITSLTNRKSESDSKCASILPKMECLADVCYCTQLFHRLCCNTFQKTGIYANIHTR